MTDKKDDDLNLEDKLAKDLLDDMDDFEELGELDELDDLDDFEDDPDEEKTSRPNLNKEEQSLDNLDAEISSLNEELDNLEGYDDELDDDELDDDELDDDELEDDELEDGELEDGELEDDELEDDEAEDELEALEDKQKKKNALIMKGGMGVFALMVGGFVYNLMFAGELPNESNVAYEEPSPQQISPVIDVDSKTPSMDDTFAKVESEVYSNSATTKSESSIGKKSIKESDLTSKVIVEQPLPIEVTPINENADFAEIASSEAEAKIITAKPSEKDVEDALYKKLTEGMNRAQGIHINTSGMVVDQNMSENELSVGTEVTYYGYNTKIISIFFEGKLALLSNGTFIDNERVKIDSELMRMAEAQKLIEMREKELIAKNQSAEKDKMLKLAEEKAREEERLKAKEQQKAQQLKLEKALERINSLAKEVEKKKDEPKKPEPKLLEGWSVNGEFKAVKNGYVLNGYLVRDADGNFYKMLVGDTNESLGLIRGYDGNGRFFIGNSYIL